LESVLAGAVTFALAGLVGVLVFHRPLVPLRASFQGLAPAFAGLFAIPWVLQNLFSRNPIPAQRIDDDSAIPPGLVTRGIGAGVVGGLLAAFLPVVNGSIGGLLAGQATAQRDDRLFLVSQGACKVVYYVGALLLFFAPGLHLVRGGMAATIRLIYVPYRQTDYWLAVAAAALCGALAFCILLGLSRLACSLLSRVDRRLVSWTTLTLLTAVVGGTTGWGGLLIASAGACIGLLPWLFGTRRMNCLGVILVPILLDMAGVSSALTAWLRLV
jgi:putative membrane protein